MLHSTTQVNLALEAHLVAKLEDFAPTAKSLQEAIVLALDAFFRLREEQKQEAQAS